MDDLISRQDVLQECKAEFLNTNVQRQTERQTLIDQSFAKGWNACNRQWMNEVLQLPPAQPERKKGKWIYDGDCYICNQCKSAFSWWADSQTSNYCPDCGADMRGESDGQRNDADA